MQAIRLQQAIEKDGEIYLSNSPYADRKSALIPQPLLPEREKGSKSHF